MATISLIDAVILGVVEGVTEFIPVSSTGHLILASSWLGLHGETVSTFEIFIQLGAILAVAVLYWPRFLGLLDVRRDQLQALQGASFLGFHGMARLALAAAPIFVLGALFGSKIKEVLFNPVSVAIALLAGGIVMIAIEITKRSPIVAKLEDISLRHAGLIGLFQCFALWPGVSRAGSTIVGAMLCGLNRRTAAEFSFLIAVPVMCVATLADLAKSFHVLSAADLPAFAVGFAVSFVTAMFAVKTFIAALGKVTLVPFALYRIVVGIAVLCVMQ